MWQNVSSSWCSKTTTNMFYQLSFLLPMYPVWQEKYQFFFYKCNQCDTFFWAIFLTNVTSLKKCILQLICRDNYKYEVTSPNGAQGSHEQLQLEVSQHFDCIWGNKSSFEYNLFIGGLLLPKVLYYHFLLC